MNIILSLAFIFTIYWQYLIFQKNEMAIIKLQQNLIYQEALRFNVKQALTLSFFENKEAVKDREKNYKFPRKLKFCSFDDSLEDRTELSFYTNHEFIELNYLGKVLREGKYFIDGENLVVQNSRHFKPYSDIQKITIFYYDKDGLPLSLNHYPYRDKPCFNPSL